MAKNRKVFGAEMRTGADAAWNNNWKLAIASYQRALAEFPNDPDALASLGSAYVGAGQLEDALGPYQRASECTPDDPTLYERIGQIQEELGRGKDAAKAYLTLADHYLGQPRSAHLALERWHDVIRVDPGNVTVHAKLLQYYQKQGQVREAVGECLALARLYSDQGHNDYAIQVCEHGLKLAPNDAEVAAALDKLRSGTQIAVQAQVEAAPAESDDLFAVAGEVVAMIIQSLTEQV